MVSPPGPGPDRRGHITTGGHKPFAAPRVHSGELPSIVGRSKGSTLNCAFGAKRWWVVQCRTPCSTERSRYTNSERPS